MAGSLQQVQGKAENGAVRDRMRIAALAVAVLAIGVTGIAQVPPKVHATVAPAARIDINTATLDELMKMPGMTRIWAVRIIRFRPYHTKRDLVDDGIVSDKVYDRIKDLVIAHRDRQ